MIVGVGNILLKDEGIGVHVVRALQEMSLASPDGDVEVIDGGNIAGRPRQSRRGRQADHRRRRPRRRRARHDLPVPARRRVRRTKAPHLPPRPGDTGHLEDYGERGETASGDDHHRS